MFNLHAFGTSKESCYPLSKETETVLSLFIVSISFFRNVGQHQNVVKSGSSEILVDEKAKMKMLPDDGYLVVTSR